MIPIRQINKPSGARKILLKSTAIISLLISLTSAIMITVLPPHSLGRIGMMLVAITGFTLLLPSTQTKKPQ